MLGPVAAVVCLIFILYCFWVDQKRNDDVSGALWIPLIWMFLAGTRFVSHWLHLGPPDGVDVHLDGNPLDRGVFLILIVAGLAVLARRRFRWAAEALLNGPVLMLFLFGAMSVFWSEYPEVSLRRLLKALGNVVMAFVILTDKNPYTAVGVVLRRLAFVTLPLSVLFIRYYPELGRAYANGGQVILTGVAMGKNGLGQLCLISGIYFYWTLLHRPLERLRPKGFPGIPLDLVFLGLVCWLMVITNSATSTACLVVAVGVLTMSRLRIVNRAPTRILTVGMFAVALLGILEIAFNLRANVITFLGRDETLTTRVPMWQDLLNTVVNPWIGVGFEVYWLTEAGRDVSERWAGIFQAHNGYLELYLNLGAIGVLILLGSIIVGFFRAARYLCVDYSAAVLRLVFIVVVVLSNWTEATWRSVSNPWLLFLLAAINVPLAATARSTVPKPLPTRFVVPAPRNVS